MLVLCETQRNTWKPWQGDEIWQRSFCALVHPQENDVLFIVLLSRLSQSTTGWIGIALTLEKICPTPSGRLDIS